MATEVKAVLDALQQMQKCLECSVCLELLSDPHSTRCNHQFCGNCIRQVIEKGSKNAKNTWFCPLCKTAVSRRSLTPNPRLEEIVTAVRHLHNAIKQDAGTSGSPPVPPSHDSVGNPGCSDPLQTTTCSTRNQNNVEPPVQRYRTRGNLRRAASSTKRIIRVKNNANTSNGPNVLNNIYVEEEGNSGGQNGSDAIRTNTNISSSFSIRPSGKKAVKVRKGRPSRRSTRLSNRETWPYKPPPSKDTNKELCQALESIPLARLDRRGELKDSTCKTTSNEKEALVVADGESEEVDQSSNIEMERDKSTIQSVLLLEGSSGVTTNAKEDTTIKSPCPIASSNTRPVDKEVVKSTDTSTVSSRAESCSGESINSVSVLRNLSMFDAEKYVDVDAKEDSFADVEKSVGDACSKRLDNIVLAHEAKKPVQKETSSKSHDGENDIKDYGDVNCNTTGTVKRTSLTPFSNVHSFDKLGDPPEKDASCSGEMKISRKETFEIDAVTHGSPPKDQSSIMNVHTQENGFASAQSHVASDFLQYKNEDKRFSEEEVRCPITDSPMEQRTDSYSNMCVNKTNEEFSLKEMKSLKTQEDILEENCTLNRSETSEEGTTLAEAKNLLESSTDDSDLCERVKRRNRTKNKVLQVGENKILSPKTSISPNLETKEAAKPLLDEFSDSQDVFRSFNENTRISDKNIQENNNGTSDGFNEVTVKDVGRRCRVREKLCSDPSSSNSSSQRSVEEIIPASVPSLKGLPDMVIDPMIPYTAGNCPCVAIPTSSLQSSESKSEETPFQTGSLRQFPDLICRDALDASNGCTVDCYLEDTFKNKVFENRISCQNKLENSQSVLSCTSDLIENVISLASKAPDSEDDDQTLDSFTSSNTLVPYLKDQPTTPCLFGGDSVAFTSSESTCDQRSSKKLSLRTKRNKGTRERVSKSSESSRDTENSFPRNSFNSLTENKSNDRFEDNSTCQSISLLQNLDDTLLERNVASKQQGENLINDRIIDTLNGQTTSDEEPSPKRLKSNHERTTDQEKEVSSHHIEDDESAVQRKTIENKNFKNSLDSPNSSPESFQSSSSPPRALSKFQSISSHETEDDSLYDCKGTKRTCSQKAMIGCEFKFVKPLPSSSYGIDDASSQDDVIPPTPPVSKHGVIAAYQIPPNKSISAIVHRGNFSPTCDLTTPKHNTRTKQGQTSPSGIAKRKIYEENSQSPKLKRVCDMKENALKEEDTVGDVQDSKIDYKNVSQDAEDCVTDETNTMAHQDDASEERDDDWQDSPTDKLLLEPTFVHDETTNEQFEKSLLPEDEPVNHSHHEKDRQELYESVVSGENRSQEAHETGEEDPSFLQSQTSSQEGSQVLSVSGHLDSTSVSSFLSDASLSTQNVDKLKELVMDKEQEMKALERYIASCNEAKEQVIRQMDLEEMENEKDVESEDDMFTEGELSNHPSPTPPPPLSPGSIPPPRQLPSPLLAMSKYLSQNECSTDEEERGDDLGSVVGFEEQHLQKTSGTQEFTEQTQGLNSNENQRKLWRAASMGATVNCRKLRDIEDTCCSSRPSTADNTAEDQRKLRREGSMDATVNCRKLRDIEDTCCSSGPSTADNTAEDQGNYKPDPKIDKRFSRSHNSDCMIIEVKLQERKNESDDNEDVDVLEGGPCPSPATLSMSGRKRLLFDQTVRKSPVVNVAWSGSLHQSNRKFGSSTPQSLSAKSSCTKESNLKRRTNSFSPLESIKSQFQSRASRTEESSESKLIDTPIRSTPSGVSSSQEIAALRVRSEKNHNASDNAAEVTFVTTRLGKRYMNSAKALAEDCGGKLVSDFSAKATHVIMNTDDEMHVSRNHYTMKYLYGLALGKWIVSHQWVAACTVAGRLVPEEQFEVKGDAELGHTAVPHITRKARENGDPPLFGSFEVMCFGAFGNSITKAQLEQLLTYCGAKVYYNASLSDSLLKNQNLVVIVDKDDKTSLKNCRAASHRLKIKVVSVEWVTDSVANYQVQDLKTYEIYPVSRRHSS